MFNLFKKQNKIAQINQKIELMKAKAALLNAKNKINEVKPSKYDKIITEIEQITDLKEVIGTGDTSKWLKLLQNPVVLNLIMKFLESKGISKNDGVADALSKLKGK